MLLAGRPRRPPPRVVVTDFGLASPGDATGRAASAITVTGELLGTPDYMAPEQIEGGAVTPATDIYALGVVLYEMVTGERPFAADTPIASALQRIVRPAAQAPRELCPDLPPAWDRAIMRCLARQPERPLPDATAVVSALEPARQRDPRRPSSRCRVAVLAPPWLLAVAVLGGAASRAGPRVAGAADGAPSSRGNDGGQLRPAVAVLGFRNLAGRDDAHWLSMALSEMLTTELAAGEALRTDPGREHHADEDGAGARRR